MQFFETMMGKRFYQATMPSIAESLEKIASRLEEKENKEEKRETVRFKRLSDTAKVPTRGSSQAAGYDLYADLETQISILPHKTELISAGISIAVPDGYFGGIYARSGLATKQGLRPANCVGVVDSDYRGPVKVALHNDSDEIRYVDPGERIAQLIVQPYLQFEFEEGELDDTDRGAGGFGSTGTK